MDGDDWSKKKGRRIYKKQKDEMKNEAERNITKQRTEHFPQEYGQVWQVTCARKGKSCRGCTHDIYAFSEESRFVGWETRHI